MKNRKCILFLLNLIVIAAAVFPQSTVRSQNTSEIDEQAKESVLNATIQIYSYDITPGNPHPALSTAQAQALIQGGYQYLIARSLGSVVNIDGQKSIVTHNHWGSLLLEADLIEIRNAQGKVLLQMTAAQMPPLLRYQDAGTAVLAAPEGLDIQPAGLGEANQVHPGVRVLAVHQSLEDYKQIEVIETEITGSRTFESLPAWTKWSKDSYLRWGDSGGGVWLDGKLVGNNWAVENTYNWKFWTWQSWAPEKIPTHSSYVAIYPFPGFP